jgi:UDP-glucuronate 4-epimerase
MLGGRSIDVFNNGNMVRDFTYIDDVVEGLVRVVDKPAVPDPEYAPVRPDPATSSAPYRVFNIGNSQPTPLMDYILALEKALGIEAKKNWLPMQAGDVPATSADTSALEDWVGFRPATPVQTGVNRFAHWYRQHYGTA